MISDKRHKKGAQIMKNFHSIIRLNYCIVEFYLDLTYFCSDLRTSANEFYLEI